MLLILDLHGTIVNFKGTQFRPHLKSFFQTCKEHKVNLAIYSAGQDGQVQELAEKLRHVFKVDFVFVWSERDCVIIKENFFKVDKKHPHASKPLSRVVEKFGDVNMFILDDTQEVVQGNLKQWIRIRSWNGETSDTELQRVAQHLLTLVYELE
jgi:2-hydroxy-3-keto-5-methylthiopentenyl-1-phosphate phosphatase